MHLWKQNCNEKGRGGILAPVLSWQHYGDASVSLPGDIDAQIEAVFVAAFEFVVNKRKSVSGSVSPVSGDDFCLFRRWRIAAALDFDRYRAGLCEPPDRKLFLSFIV